MAQDAEEARRPGATTATTALTETSPLLKQPPATANAQPDPSSSEAAPTPTHRSRCTWPWIYVILVCIGVSIISDLGETLFSAPRIRFLESIACTRYYRNHDPSLLGKDGSVPERFCKIDLIQDKVASIMGWQLFFDSIPAILLPVPYGYLADSRGRKWILVLGLVGFAASWASIIILPGVLDLPLETVWLSSLFYLIGGGPTTGTALLTTVVADVVPKELRSTVFFYRFCTDQVADLVIPPLAALMMAKDTWLPLLVGVSLQLIAVLLSLSLPETLPVADESVEELPGSADDDDGHKQNAWLSRFRESFAFISRDATIAAIVFTFLISKVGRQSCNVLFQYVSKRYGWPLSQATLLVSLRAGVNILLFTAVLPGIATFILAGKSPAFRDLIMGKASIALLIVGYIIMFLSQSAGIMIVGLIVITLGAGFPPIMRSLVTFLVESHHASQTSDVGRLYALIAVMEGVGSLLAGPGMAWAFRVGIAWGRAWLGLPFAVAAVLFASVSVVVFRIRF